MNAISPLSLGLSIQQLREFIVRPALERISMWSQAAENLVLGTAIHESHLRFVDQLAPGPGPAYGICQMERPTYEDIWKNYIPSVPGLRSQLLDIAGFDFLPIPPVTELHGNLFYAAAMCRVQYYRAPEPLPPANDAYGMAALWKKRYNTPLGKGTIEKALPAFRLAITQST